MVIGMPNLLVCKSVDVQYPHLLDDGRLARLGGA